MRVNDAFLSLYVIDLGGKLIKIRVDIDYKICDIKSVVSAKTGIPIGLFDLSLQGGCLGAVTLCDGDVLQMIGSLRGGGPKGKKIVKRSLAQGIGLSRWRVTTKKWSPLEMELRKLLSLIVVAFRHQFSRGKVGKPFGRSSALPLGLTVGGPWSS